MGIVANHPGRHGYTSTSHAKAVAITYVAITYPGAEHPSLSRTPRDSSRLSLAQLAPYITNGLEAFSLSCVFLL